MISAKDSEVGKTYLTATGIQVHVVSKGEAILVKSSRTGNTIELPPDYLFKEEINSEETIMTDSENVQTPTVVAPVKEKRGKKSTIIDEGVKANLSTDEIVQKIIAAYPDFPEKNIRNLISVRRSKIKKAAK